MILIKWHFKNSQPIFRNVVTKSIIAKCYVKITLIKFNACRILIFSEKKSSIFVIFFTIFFKINPFLESRDPCTSYLPGWAGFGWSFDNNFHCNYTLSYELFPFFLLLWCNKLNFLQNQFLQRDKKLKYYVERTVIYSYPNKFCD